MELNGGGNESGLTVTHPDPHPVVGRRKGGVGIDLYIVLMEGRKVQVEKIKKNRSIFDSDQNLKIYSSLKIEEGKDNCINPSTTYTCNWGYIWSHVHVSQTSDEQRQVWGLG